MSKTKTFSRFDIPDLVREALAQAVALRTLDPADVYALCSEHGRNWSALMTDLVQTAWIQRQGTNTDAHSVLCRLNDAYHASLKSQ